MSSWAERGGMGPARRRRPARVLSALAVAVALLAGTVSGCGFTPLYGNGGGGAGGVNSRQLAAIDIGPLANREGQLVHAELVKFMNPRGLDVPTRWRLEMGLTRATQDLGIRKDETATRAILRLSANFKLRDSRTGHVVLSGNALSTNSFNILDSRFATLASEESALHRAARELGRDIGARVAVFLARDGR